MISQLFEKNQDFFQYICVVNRYFKRFIVLQVLKIIGLNHRFTITQTQNLLPMKSQSDKKDPKLAAKESDFSFIQKFAQFLFSKKYKKKEFLLRAGEINDRIFYVKKGLLRVYMVYEEKEINTWFVKENEFISSVNSYYNETPSEEFIQALEDSEIISFKKSTYSMVLKHNHKLALFAIKQLYIKLCEYSDQCQYLRILSAEKKYEFLKKKNPEVLERVSQKHVASFLGIETTYLNKIIASHKE